RDREGVGGASQGQDREGHAAAGEGHRPDQAGRSQHRLDRLREADHRGHGSEHGHRCGLASRRSSWGWGPADRGEPRTGRASRRSSRRGRRDMATIVNKRVGKRYDAAAAKITPDKQYAFEEAVALVKSMPATKFDQSVDLSFRLGVDPKHADQ